MEPTSPRQPDPESRPEESRPEESRSGEGQPEENPPEKSRSGKGQPEENPPEKSRSGKGQPEEIRPEKSRPGKNPPREEGLPPGTLYRMAWGLYLVLALAGGVWIGLREGSIPLALFFDAGRWWLDLAAGLGAAMGLLGAWEAGRRSLRLARELEAQLGRVLGTIDPQEALALALLSGFAEELFFRGAVQGAFPSYGWLWAALLFSLLHTGPGRPYRLWTLFAFLAGLVFGLLTVWSGNLLAAVTAHAVVNAINLRRLARQGSETTTAETPSAPA